ncbi:MAG TPA: hypothetical protein VGO43_06995 [Pyrinomonadaceae bacterium]|jgi:hypothetical protein|nr:hypothetical protein [Pyrinomonadaceae bacterium]
MMPIGAILDTQTLSEAMEFFIAHGDYKENILEVHSLKVGGHEMIGTFLR